MADRTINVVISGSVGSTTGGKTGTSADKVGLEQERQKTIQLKEEERRRTLDHKAEVAKRTAEEKRAYKQQVDDAKKASKEKIAEEKKTTQANSNTWANALKSYQFKFNALGNIISNVVSTATRMLGQLGASIVTVSKDFELAMSGVKAITMATDKEFKQLRDDAVRLGGQTIFTASQVAKLQEELAKLGFSVSEIRAATDGVVALAAATGEDLAQSALVAGTVIRGFGLNANELTRVVDVMTESFNRSALDLYKFQETMKYVAPIASKVGFSLEETTALMTKLADQGIVASQAGTGLRNIMLRLADANSKLSKAMGGSAKSLPELIIGLQRLKESGIDATGALKLVDRYSVTAFLGLIKSSDKIWEMYKNLVLASGSAQKMSEIRMDNFAGSVEKLVGAWQSFILTINKGNGALRGIVDAVRWAVDGITRIIQDAQTKAGIAGQQEFKDFKDRINQQEQKAMVEMVKAQDKRLTEYKNGNDKTKEAYKKFQDDMDKIEKEAYDKKLKARESVSSEIKKIEENASVQFGTTASPSGLDAILNMPRDAKQKEEFTKMLTYYNELKQLQISFQQEAIQAQLDYNTDLMAAIEEQTAEEKRIEREKADLKIELMLKGFEREIAEVNKHYDELKAKAIQYGFDYAQSEKNRNEELRKIWEERRRYFENLGLDIHGVAVMDKKALKLPVKLELSKDFTENAKELTEEDKKKLKDMKDSMGRLTGAEEGTGKQQNKDLFDMVFGDGKLSSEQKQALKEGVNFITDQLQKIVDKETEIADRRVENAERVVDQLQQDLQTEIQLAEAGFANNVSLKQRELEEAKKQQAKALIEQKKAVDNQRKMEAILQASSLITASANTFAQMSKLGPWGIAAAIAEIAVMWGAFGLAQVKAKELTKYGDGGEIGGNKHSQGGTLIEAERGEFVVRANSYAKHADLVQAINNDNLNQIYGALNKDLSVSLDDSGTAKMLNKHFGKKQTTYGNGYRIEQTGNRIRKIKYA